MAKRNILSFSKFFLLIFFVSSSVTYAQVTVVRELPENVSSGGELTVTLKMEVGKERPTGIIVVERIPQGVNPVSAFPKANFDISTRELKWSFLGNDVKNKTLITYKVRTSPDMSGKAVFSGIVKTLKGVNEIIGDKELIVVKKSIIEEREREKKICGASFILLLAFLLYFISKKFLRMV